MKPYSIRIYYFLYFKLKIKKIEGQKKVVYLIADFVRRFFGYLVTFSSISRLAIFKNRHFFCNVVIFKMLEVTKNFFHFWLRFPENTRC